MLIMWLWLKNNCSANSTEACVSSSNSVDLDFSFSDMEQCVVVNPEVICKLKRDIVTKKSEKRKPDISAMYTIWIVM